MSDGNFKEKNIEYMRAIGCAGVVLIHVFKSAHDIYGGQAPSIMFLSAAFVNNLRWCVPVFLMITGSLLLIPEKKITLRKIADYIWRIAVVLAVFGTGYAFMELVFSEKTVRISMIPKAILNAMTGNTWDHLWYLYTLIMLYCFLPLIKACAALENKYLKFMVAMMFFYTSVLPTLKGIGITLGITVNTVSIYMLYMILGYMIKRNILRIPNVLAWIGIFSSIIFLTVMAYCSDILQLTVNNALISHSSVAVVIQSICIFYLLTELPRVRRECLEHQILHVADASFGIYILHMFYINLFYKVLNINPNVFGAVIFVPVYIVVLIFTYGTVLLLRKNPVIRRYL